jgi:hypothetical protein
MSFKTCYLQLLLWGWWNQGQLPSHTISVAMEQWTAHHCAFVVETFLKNSDSITKIQHHEEMLRKFLEPEL